MMHAPANVVLIVDDDEAICFLFKVALEQMGCTVFTATNGREGLECLGSIPKPNVILLDLMMPELDGWGFLAGIDAKSEWREIPVVACTAFNVQASDLNVKSVLSKPVDLAQLTDAVRKWCPVGTAAPLLSGAHVE